MRISKKKLAEARVKEAEKELLKAKKELKEALICGPTGSFTSSVAHSSKIMGYTGLHEAEDDEYEFEDDPCADTETAVEIAYPEASEEVKNIITTWYNNECAYEDFSDDYEFADYITEDIGAMLDAASDPERSIVARELVAKEYLDDDLWSSDLEESVKKPLKESVSEKPFDEVEEGDIGKDYSGNEVIILAKGPASKFSNADGFEEFVDLSDYDPEDTDFNNQIDAEWPECVLVEFVEDGSKVVYSYGSDGVVVPQKRVRQISFDFIDIGKEADSDLLLMVQDAMTRRGMEIVGGPAFGDTSWSKEEYGLKEEIIGKGKYGIEVKDPRGLWVPASENYPRNGEPAEFKKEDDAKNSDLYKRLVGRYGEDRVRTYRQD